MGVLAITASHRAHAWHACVIAGSILAFVPVRRSRAHAILLASGILGAAIGATILPALLRAPAAIATWSPGPLLVGDRMAFGALGGFALAVAIAARWRARSGAPATGSALPALDALSPSMGVLVAAGRVGCFLEGCDFGAPASLAWAVRYPIESHAFAHQLARGLVRPTDGASLPVHPAQLYEALVGAAMIAVAIAMLHAKGRDPRGRRAAEGAVLRATLAVYAAGRLVVEMARGDDRGALGPLSVPQWIAIATLAWCAAGLLDRGRHAIVDAS